MYKLCVIGVVITDLNLNIMLQLKYVIKPKKLGLKFPPAIKLNVDSGSATLCQLDVPNRDLLE